MIKDHYKTLKAKKLLLSMILTKSNDDEIEVDAKRFVDFHDNEEDDYDHEQSKEFPFDPSGSYDNGLDLYIMIGFPHSCVLQILLTNMMLPYAHSPMMLMWVLEVQVN